MSTVIKQRQLNLDELRRLKWLLGGAMALVSLWTVFFLDIEALGLVGVASAVVLAALIWPQLPAKVPAIIWKLSVPAIIIVSAVDFYLSPDTLPVLIRLAILLVLYRTVSYRRKREDLQLIVLGMFLIVVAGVLTVSLGFAFLLLLFTACALGFLFVINLIDASETDAAASNAGTAWTRLSGKRFFSRLGAVADWRLIGFAFALFTAVVVMSGVLFLIIPRFEFASGFFLDRYITRKSRTGFTDNVRFGDVTELVRDTSVAMRVDLTDSTGLTERPYWRMVVLDEYTPQGFRVSGGLKAELLRNQHVTQRVPGHPTGRGVSTVGGVWTFYIEPGVSRFLPLPGSFAMMHLRDPVPVQWSTAHHIVALRTEPMAMTAFQLEAVEQTARIPDVNFLQLLQEAKANPGKFSDQLRYNARVNLTGPSGAANETVLRRMLDEISRSSTLSAEEFARRATGWLQSHHVYALSARLPAGEGKDDIVRWLDSSEPGFCEYFTAGFVVVARAAGYPARMVTGFHGGVLNAFENYYMVRNSDAHAWAEIYDGHGGWLRVDATPGAVSSIEEALRTPLGQQEHDNSWSARLDSLRVLWYRRIVNFDSRSQVQMFEKVKTLTLDSSSAVRARLEALAKNLKAWLRQPWNPMRIAKIAGLIAAIVAGFWSLLQIVRWSWRRWRRWRRPQEFDPIRREAGRQLTQLRMVTGIQVRQSDEGEMNAVVADLRRLRYGKRETWPEPGSVFKKAKRAQKNRS